MVLKRDGMRYLGLPVMLLAVAGMLTSCTVPIPGFDLNFAAGSATLTRAGSGDGTPETITVSVSFCSLPSFDELESQALDLAAEAVPGISDINITRIDVVGLDLEVFDADGVPLSDNGITDVSITFIAQDGTRIALGSASSAAGFGDTINLDTANIDFLGLIRDIQPGTPCPSIEFSGSGILTESTIRFDATITVRVRGTVTLGS